MCVDIFSFVRKLKMVSYSNKESLRGPMFKTDDRKGFLGGRDEVVR